VILYLLYILMPAWFLQVNCCQKRVKILSDSYKGKDFLILSYVCGFKFGPVWQGALLGRNSALLEKCLSSDYDGSSDCRRKCLCVVLLLHI